MGWTFQNRPKGIKDRDWFQDKMGERYTIVESGSRLGEFYAAIRDNTTGEVTAFVALTRWDRGSYHNFGYKDMDETMGPVIDNPPVKVLDALTPTDNQYANDWRDRARKNIKRRDVAKDVKPGTVITFPKPLSFGAYGQFDRFTFVSRTTFRTDTGLNVRIPGWKNRNYRVVADAA